MIWGDSTWLTLFIWLGLLALGTVKEQYLGAMGGLVGILFGFILITNVSGWLGIIVIFINFYVFYHFLFTEAKGGR